MKSSKTRFEPDSADVDRRELLKAGIAFAVPLGGLSFLSGCQPAKKPTESDESKNSDENETSKQNTSTDEIKGREMKIQYLEIVTPEVDALCQQYAASLGLTFSEPEANLGNARTAKLPDGCIIGIRGPMRDTETPVIRPYMLVEDLDKAVKAAADAGAEVAIPKMEIPGYGTIGIVIQGGIECGLWQN